ncbi:uncharacterized protein C16orf96 homolog isoform X2 [Pangasianodon hypophthalmus]|uniref:uncharacterized protein C16orf96 homolog isoform X2 n=1 Tax=Pangasianodon hypophthalmus TaxID=310915 RepID=UPI002307B073|nr:uncharacterized protein C16orf96 homolog isoform X2 [Pangasianodon hypophthalmus]
MSKESLFELLKLSIDSPEGGVVNFKALRALLHGILKCLCARRDADAGRDVEEKSSEQQEAPLEAPLEQLSSHAQLPSLSAPDTSAQQDSEERVSKCMCLMQDLVKENQELKEETHNLKKEVKTLQNQLTQCMTWEAVQTALISEREKIMKELKDSITGPPTSRDAFTAVSDGDLPDLAGQTLSQVSSGVEHYPETLETLTDVGRLQEKHESLEARVKHLEGERENILAQMNQLKTQLDTIMADRKKTSELTSDVQGVVLQLQAECEKLHSTTNQLMKDHMQEQSHIEHLYKTVKELDEKKADKKAVKIGKGIKADMQALETRVLQCDTTTEQLNRMFQDLLNNITDHEENCHKVIEKIFRELDCKLNNTELDPLKNQLEDCRTRMLKQIEAKPALECDDAAVLKKQIITRFNCLSCDRPVNMITPGPRLLALPELPSLPPSKHNRSLKPCTNLGQCERSPTDMEQTMMFRESDSSGSDAHVYKECQDTSDVKTMEVRLPTISPKEDYCKNKDMVSHGQLLTSSGRKPSRLLPLRPQHAKTPLNCSGSSCFEKDKQWLHEDSLPQTPLSPQEDSSVPSAKKT